MERFRQDQACDRARAWASLDLDGELSQLERALLAAHLRRCAECAAAVGEMRGVTALLRAAPVEEPEQSFAPPRRRLRPRVPAGLASRVVAATGVTVVAASLGVLAGALERSRPAAKKAPSSDVALLVVPRADEDRLIRSIKGPVQERERMYPPGRLGGV
jgi:anti-sigma factor RsiW